MTKARSTKISKDSVVLILTICYWLATLPLAWYGVQRETGWFLLLWFGVMAVFALPVTAIVWTIAWIDRRVLKSRLPTFGLIALGVAIPTI
jgi:hypothetical protein